MTITYTREVATSSFSCFLKLLARWRGSIYKLLWKDFMAFAAIYFILGFIYRFVLNAEQKKTFEMISRYCESNNGLIPVAFILGFYVTLIMTRWWNQLGSIPWPDHMAMYVTANVRGLDERGRLMRRTMVRYVCLAFTITMTCISPAVKKRFPTNKHIVDAGLMTENEKEILENMPAPYGTFFVPLTWATALVNRARKEGRITDDFAVKTLIDEINDFRRSIATLHVYDWITVPLVYTQVVTLAVYMFFLANLMGRQFLNDNPDMPDMYFPLFTFLEYFFYMGWLKVAECLVNPFGEDEEDFDCNFLIDRNLHVAYQIVDEATSALPELVRDRYWDEAVFEVPYTIAAEPFRIKNPLMGSTADLTMSVKDKEYVLPPSLMEVIDEGDSRDGLDEQEPGSPTESTKFGSSLFSGGRKTSRNLALKRLFSRNASATAAQRLSRSSHGYEEGYLSSPKVSTVDQPISPVTPTSHQLQFEYESDTPEIDDDDLEVPGGIRMVKLGKPRGRFEPTTSASSSAPTLKPSPAQNADNASPATSGKSPSASQSTVVPGKSDSAANPLEPSSSTNNNSSVKADVYPTKLSVDLSTAPPDLFQSVDIPESPTSPDPSVWVQASSQWLLPQVSELQSTNKEERV